MLPRPFILKRTGELLGQCYCAGDDIGFQLVELGSQFAVNDIMGVKFKGLPAALFWRAAYLFKLESPENRARIAADWFLDLFFHPSVTQIRGR